MSRSVAHATPHTPNKSSLSWFSLRGQNNDRRCALCPVSRVASGIAEAEAVASAVSAKGSRGAAKRLAEAENKGNAGTCALCVCSQADSCLSKPPNVPLKNPPKGPCYSASKLFEASWKCPRPGSANSCLRPTANPPLSKKPLVSRLARSGGLL